MAEDHDGSYLRYAQLPKEVRDWLEHLRPDEVPLFDQEELKLARQALNFMRSAETMGVFVKWLIIGGASNLLIVCQLRVDIAILR